VELAMHEVRTADGLTLKLGACAGGGIGPSILILHGLYSHMGWYRRLGESLAAQGAAVFLLDRRGAGISGGLAGHMQSWRHVADDLLRVVARIRALRPGWEVCALGISLGATMMLATSLVERGAFRRHAALSPGLAPALRLPFARRAGLAWSAWARPRFLYELPFTAEQLTDRVALRDRLWNDPLRTRLVTSRFLLEVFRMQRFVRQNIVRLDAPLLALVAADDAMVDNEAALGILRSVRRTPVRVEIYERACHVLPASVPMSELTGRIWHWFTAEDDALDRRVVIHSVPPFPADAVAEDAEGPSGCPS
jgi:alpha-beta hydrolase superfamily lysophospholipase